MLWLDLIDILFLVAGLLLGYVVCYLNNRDLMHDECEECPYREYVLEVIEHERKE